MDWIKENYRLAVLHAFALALLAWLIARGAVQQARPAVMGFELESGLWAVRFLLACLSISPLRTFFGWNQLVELRKPLGLWSFGFALVHVGYFLSERELVWRPLRLQFVIALGAAGMIILSLLALTSNRWSMRRLRKNWKRLHRLVYAAGAAVVAHAMLATTTSKRLAMFHPEAIRELSVYAVVLAVLLVVRVPLVRRAVVRLRRPRRRTQPAYSPPQQIETSPDTEPVPRELPPAILFEIERFEELTPVSAKPARSPIAHRHGGNGTPPKRANGTRVLPAEYAQLEGKRPDEHPK